jgi:hypothetical protein
MLLGDSCTGLMEAGGIVQNGFFFFNAGMEQYIYVDNYPSFPFAI